MQSVLSLLGILLAAGTVVVGYADFRHVPVDSPLGLGLGRFFLLPDEQAVESARLRIDKIGFAGAEKVFDAALQRDPGSAYRWIDVGEMILHNGNRSAAERCYIRAGELAPHDVRILLDLGDFYSIVGKTETALKAFSEILSQTQAPAQDILTANVFGYYQSMKVIQNHLLDLAIPEAPSAAAYLQYVTQTGDTAAMREVWDWACGKGFDTDKMALDYTAYLFGKQQYDAAERGWVRHFAHRSQIDKDGYPKSSRIFNGGFEYETTFGAFDWQFYQSDAIKGTRDRQIRQAGEYSYRLDFTGNDNVNFRGFSQKVYTTPGKYHFEGWMRTANVTSNEGFRFRLRTSRDFSNFAVETPALTGTNDWTRLDADIDVPPGASVLEVDLARRPSIRIDNQLKGTVWIDSLSLTPR